MTSFRIRTLSIRDQQARFRAAYPDFETKRSGNLLVCLGWVRPTPLSNEYLVRLNYELYRTPAVEVEEPKLVRRNPDERIPHTYDGDKPCTFRPNIDWRSDRNIAIVIPWISLWLFSYEVWLATGEWLFGGVGHSSTGRKLPEAKERLAHD